MSWEGYFEFELHDEGAIVVATRTSTPYPNPDAGAAALSALADLLSNTPGVRAAIHDIRAVMGQNDSSFEHAIAGPRARMFRATEACAIVVRSAVGALQVRRHVASDGVEAGVFSDLDDALAYVRSRIESPPRVGNGLP